MAYIYKITNDINGKIYVVKTEYSIEKRFQEHCKDYKVRDKEKRPLYSAMKKYGIEHFHIEKIEECDNPNERERYWIEYYGSFKNGYNATIGGDGKSYLDYELIYKTYLQVKNCTKTAQIVGCSKDSVEDIIKNIYKISSDEIDKNWRKNYSLSVAMVDKESGEIIKTFIGTREAGKYLNKTHQHIQEVCQGKRKSAYGYYWKYI